LPASNDFQLRVEWSDNSNFDATLGAKIGAYYNSGKETVFIAVSQGSEEGYAGSPTVDLIMLPIAGNAVDDSGKSYR